MIETEPNMTLPKAEFVGSFVYLKVKKTIRHTLGLL